MIVSQDIYHPLYEDNEKFIILITGGRGSGKSFNASTFIERLTFEMTPVEKIVHQILYTRYTMVSAGMSIIPEMMEKIDLDGTTKYFKTTKTDIVNKMTKSRIMFRGIKTSSGNQTAKLKSIQGITTFVCDEAEEWTSEDEFDKIMLSIRKKGIQNRIIIIMNPCDSNHFIYKKYIETEGLYVTSSERVSDEALLKACDIISLMLAKRPDVKAHMVKRGCHVMVIGKDEETCDLPEFAHICNCEDSIKYWNWRARGFGGAPEDELSSSCGEENLLALPQDKYVGENILIHEFAHLIHTVGIVGVEPGFNDRLEALRQNAIRKGLWKDTYAVSNKEEYFAECVQSFFNCNRYADPANGVHNWVNRRAKLKSYDPDMYRLLQEYFYEIEIPVNNIVHK